MRDGFVVLEFPGFLDRQDVVEVEAVLVVDRGFGGFEELLEVERLVGGFGGHGRLWSEAGSRK